MQFCNVRNFIQSNLWISRRNKICFAKFSIGLLRCNSAKIDRKVAGFLLQILISV